MEVYNYSDAEKTYISTSLRDDSFGSQWWLRSEDSELLSLKVRLKNHYKTVQNYRCVYCYKEYPVAHNMAWDLEHVVSRASHPGFMFLAMNLCASCKDCNREKSDSNVLINSRRKTYPKTGADFKIVHPFFDSYEEHIGIMADGKVYYAKTDKGRFTIEVCGLLRFSYMVGYSDSNSILGSDKVLELAGSLSDESDPFKRMIILDDIRSEATEMINTIKKNQ